MTQVSSIAKRIYRFGDFMLDLETGVLLQSGSDVPVRAKTFKLLCFLAANAGRVVPKAELLDAVLGRVYATEDSLTQCIRDLRVALGDKDNTIVKTVKRRGYRFAAEFDELQPIPLLAHVAHLREDRPTLAIFAF